MPRLSAALLLGALVAPTAAAAAAADAAVGASLAAVDVVCPEKPLESLTIDEVQGYLSSWNVDTAFATEFAAQKVDGFKLSLLLVAPGAADETRYPNAQPFDWMALKKYLAHCAATGSRDREAATGSERGRQLASSASAGVSGLHIKRDNAGVILGAGGDVRLLRTGDQALQLNATVDATSNVIVRGNLTVDGHVHLTSGDVNAANLAELALDVSSLFESLVSLQQLVSSNTAAISSNSAAIATNAASISANEDDVFTNAVDIATLNATALVLSECCAETSSDIVQLYDAVALLDYSVNPNTKRVVYASNFEFDYSEWTFSGADLQTTDCDGVVGVGGNLGDGDSISTYLNDLPGHSQLTVAFTFLAIDSWDGEVATAVVDGAQVWQKAFDLDDSTIGSVCGNGNAAHKDNIVVVEETFEHFMHGASVVFSSTIDQEYIDETWAVADVTVSSKLDSKYNSLYVSDFQRNGAAGWTFFGGSAAVVSTCGGETVLGGDGILAPDDTVVKKISDIGEHTELVIAFEFLKIDGWDGEFAKLFVDNQLVWSEAFDSSTGTASICGGTGTDAIVPVTIRVHHDESTAKLKFATTIDQTGLSWGLRSLSVYAHSPDENVVYQSNFASVGDWAFDGATAAVSTCGTLGVLGGYEILDYDDSVSLDLEDLVPHSTMTVSFDFVQIDTWDLESAFLYIDDQLVWTETFSGLLGTNLCGNGAKETIHPVSVSFPHYAQGVSIMVTTSINQAGTDESWGIANFKITTALEDCAHVLYASDFSSDLVDGWDINNAAINNVTTCGSDVLLGGFGNFGVGAEAIKTVSIPNGGAGVVVAFSFIKIDSWDNEFAQLYADGVLVWSEKLSGTNGVHQCGRTGAYEEKLIREIDLGWVNSDDVTLKWTSTINSDATDEAWGLEDVDIYTYDACDAVPYQSDFEIDGDDGWLLVGSSGGTTTCNGDVLLGGYATFDYSDMAQRLVDLPMHTSLQVDFTFVKIDTWDTEYMTFTADHTVKWNQQLTGGTANVCGGSSVDDYHEKTFVMDHFAPWTWLQWQSTLSSAGTDESWGLSNVKVSTFMDPNYTPVYESRFGLQQMDGWTVTNQDSSASSSFSSCGGITVFGGYNTFAVNTVAARDITHLPSHAFVTIGFTWLKIDSWDNELFKVIADGTTVYSQASSANVGDGLCGSGSTGWDESFFSRSVKVAHSADTLTLQFTTTLSSDGTDESWALAGVTVYVSDA